MIELIESLFEQYGMIIVFLGGVLESLVVIGVFVPGSILLLVGGYYASIGLISPIELMIFGVGGMYIGDVINYGLGRSLHTEMMKRGRGKILHLHMKHYQFLLKKYGTGLIGYGHVLGSIRSVVCFGAGVFGYPFKHYLFVTFISTTAWAGIFILTGILLGSASVAAHDIIQKIQLMGGILLALAVTLWIVHKKVQSTFSL